MKITGNTVGTTMPRADWAQTDPKKADYIKNKPDVLDGEDGATFTPSVSSDGTLSWTNDKGLNNPESVNLKGEKGEKGDTGDSGAKGDKGDTPNLTFGTITMLSPGDTPTASITGTAENPVLSIAIPKAEDGASVYVQNEEPDDDTVGALWFDTDGSSNAEDYIQVEAERVSENVLSVRTGKSFVFAAFTDAHMAYNSESETSAIHAGMGLKSIRGITNLDMVAHLGDYINGSSSSTKEGSKEEYRTYHKAFYEGCLGIPTVWEVGNHDANYQGGDAFTFDELYGLIGANNQSDHVVEYGNENRHYGYIDFPAKKLRVIYLNSSDAEAKTGVSGEQVSWLSSTAFDFSDKSNDTEWGFIILIHIPLTFGDCADLLSAVDTYASSGGAEPIAIFHGHCHNFRTEQVGTAKVWQIGIPELCVGRNNEYGTAGQDDEYGAIFGEFDTGGNPVYYPKTADSAQDTSFNVVTVDRGNKKIYCHVFGAGYDRELDYIGGVVVASYSVTNNLTNVSSSNTSKSAKEGSAYTAELTADSGHTLSTITVTMGGTDITSTAVSSGTINIASVTGNVVITATAVSDSGYTNLFSADDAYFADTSRFNSSGEATEGSAYVSGYISVTNGDVIRVRCPNGNYSTDSVGSQVRCLCTYTSLHTFLSAYYPADSVITLDADGMGFSFTITDSNIGFVRVSGHPSGNWEGFVVTKNEVIE